MVVHSNVYKFKCEVCKRGFKTLKSLKLHTNNHTGNKPHQCQKCPKAFNTKSLYICFFFKYNIVTLLVYFNYII